MCFCYKNCPWKNLCFHFKTVSATFFTNTKMCFFNEEFRLFLIPYFIVHAFKNTLFKFSCKTNDVFLKCKRIPLNVILIKTFLSSIYACNFNKTISNDYLYLKQPISNIPTEQTFPRVPWYGVLTYPEVEKKQYFQWNSEKLSIVK